MFHRNKKIDTKERWRFYSRLGEKNSWWHYYGNYKNVIDSLVDDIECGAAPIETVSLTLLFLIRHSLELGLKANILKLERINNDVEKIYLKGTKYHSIKKLFNKKVQHLNIIKKQFKISKPVLDEMNQYINKFEPLQDKFTELDAGSFSFRYPVDTNGVKHFNWDKEENIADIIDLYYEIQPFIAFTDAVLEEEGVVDFDEYY